MTSQFGNSGVGQHINGNAADICCYDKNGKPISSKLVCCTAQDVGFGGIANITKAYIYTHVDVRTSNIWYGDEVVNYHTVTNDFYQYFGISKADTTSKADSPKAMKGIDVSRHNGSINWNQVKNDGVQFAILRAGYGNLLSQKDSKFEEFYQGAKAVGIPIGCYWYSYAITPEDARKKPKFAFPSFKAKNWIFRFILIWKRKSPQYWKNQLLEYDSCVLWRVGTSWILCRFVYEAVAAVDCIPPVL